METGFYMCDGCDIELRDFVDALNATARLGQWSRVPFAIPTDCCARMRAGDGDFWSLVYEPFMTRELNRVQVQEVIAEGLVHSNGSYKRMLPAFGIDDSDYLRFMDFLRHHRLKPGRSRSSAASVCASGG